VPTLRTLLIQVPSGSAVERQLGAQPPAAVAAGEAIVESGPTDAEGNLEAMLGDVVAAVPSPETLEREADQIRRVLSRAGTGEEALVIVVEAASELRESELAAVVTAAGHTSRDVILRIVRDG
jgi:hypothetical protein